MKSVAGIQTGCTTTIFAVAKTGPWPMITTNPSPHSTSSGQPADASYAHIVKPVMRSGEELASGPLSGAEWLHVPPPYSSTALLSLISELAETSWHPRIVFEPAPTSCHPAEREAFEAAAPHVEVLS